MRRRVEGERLARGELRDFEVAVMHGQMHAREKRAVMARFASGEVDVLVATSVIEVGIDVPNASVMVIEEADRYGLSQLHQLRGRVGRGAHESFCLLFSGRPVGAGARSGWRRSRPSATGSGSPRSTSRCGARATCSAPASTGCRSSASRGCPRTRELLERARRRRSSCCAADPELRDPEHAVLRAALERRFGALEVEPIAA